MGSHYPEPPAPSDSPRRSNLWHWMMCHLPGEIFLVPAGCRYCGDWVEIQISAHTPLSVDAHVIRFWREFRDPVIRVSPGVTDWRSPRMPTATERGWDWSSARPRLGSTRNRARGDGRASCLGLAARYRGDRRDHGSYEDAAIKKIPSLYPGDRSAVTLDFRHAGPQRFCREIPDPDLRIRSSSSTALLAPKPRSSWGNLVGATGFDPATLACKPKRGGRRVTLTWPGARSGLCACIFTLSRRWLGAGLVPGEPLRRGNRGHGCIRRMRGWGHGSRTDS